MIFQTKKNEYYDVLLFPIFAARCFSIPIEYWVLVFFSLTQMPRTNICWTILEFFLKLSWFECYMNFSLSENSKFVIGSGSLKLMGVWCCLASRFSNSEKYKCSAVHCTQFNISSYKKILHSSCINCTYSGKIKCVNYTALCASWLSHF